MRRAALAARSRGLYPQPQGAPHFSRGPRAAARLFTHPPPPIQPAGVATLEAEIADLNARAKALDQVAHHVEKSKLERLVIKREKELKALPGGGEIGRAHV